jgi:hypothetical protein
METLWLMPLVTASMDMNMNGTNRPVKMRNMDKLSKKKRSLGKGLVVKCNRIIACELTL